MSDTESESIVLRPQLASSSPHSSWRSESTSSLGSLLVGSNYELVEAEDGSLSSVTSEDLEQDSLSDSLISVHEFSLSSPGPQSLEVLETADTRPSTDHVNFQQTYESTNSASPCAPHSQGFQEDFVQNSDSLSTLRLSYTFPDPTDNDLPPSAEVRCASPIFLDPLVLGQSACGPLLATNEECPTQRAFNTFSRPNLPNFGLAPECIGINNKSINEAEPQGLAQQLHVYLLGEPIPSDGERTLLDKLRANLRSCPALQVSAQQRSEVLGCFNLAWNTLDDYYHSFSAQVLAAPTFATHPASPSDFLRQTRGLHIVLHDFTRLPEGHARLRMESLPARPGLVICQVHSPSYLPPSWLLPILLSRHDQAGPLRLMMISRSRFTDAQNLQLNAFPGLNSVERRELKDLCLVSSQRGSTASSEQQPHQEIDALADSPPVIVSWDDVDKLAEHSVAGLQKLMIPVLEPPSPKRTWLKSAVVSLTVLALFSLLTSWFFVHSRRSVLPSPSYIPSTLDFNVVVSQSIALLSNNQLTPPHPVHDASAPSLLLKAPIEQAHLSLSESSVLGTTARPFEDNMSRASFTARLNPLPSLYPHAGPSSTVFEGTQSKPISAFSISSRPSTNQSYLWAMDQSISVFTDTRPEGLLSGRSVLILSSFGDTLMCNSTACTQHLRSAAESLGPWAMRLPNRLRKGLFNIQHRPEACLKKILKLDLPRSLHLSPLKVPSSWNLYMPDYAQVTRFFKPAFDFQRK